MNKEMQSAREIGNQIDEEKLNKYDEITNKIK